ncbi:hypothetical protein D3C81_1544550 [compost metagenome]
MLIQSFFVYSSRIWIFIRSEENGIRQIQPVEILPLFQKHHKPKIVRVAFEVLILPSYRLFCLLRFFYRDLLSLQGQARLLLDQLIQNAIEHLFPLMSEGWMSEIMGDGGAFHHLRINN